jgi:hypothetical protein
MYFMKHETHIENGCAWMLEENKFHGISLSMVHGTNYQQFDAFKSDLLVN